MKRLFFLFIVCWSQGYSQSSDQHFFYQTVGFSAGTHYGIDLNMNYIYDQNYSFKLGYSVLLRTPESQPSDYSPGIAVLFSFGLTNPYDAMQSIQGQFGKIFRLNAKGTIRFNLSMGIAYSFINEVTDWKKLPRSFFNETHTYKIKKYDVISLVFNPKIEFPFTKYYGLSLSPLIILNERSNFFGIGIEHMIGVLRK